jgi:cytochrome c oxidase subunit 3
VAHAQGDPLVAHHFEDVDQQRESVVMGMWLFLATEVMFFGGMILAYIVYRTMYPEAWLAGSRALSVEIGTVNTTVLLVSSLTMAFSVRSAMLNKSKLTALLLLATLVLGTAFLVIKGFEYQDKWVHNTVPGEAFEWHYAVPEELGPEGAEAFVRHVQLFFVLYFCMTGMHALHMVIGAGLLIWLIIGALRDKWSGGRYMPVEIVGFYWHFVDIVWIFLFPLLYLIDRTGGAHG